MNGLRRFGRFLAPVVQAALSARLLFLAAFLLVGAAHAELAPVEKGRFVFLLDGREVPLDAMREGETVYVKGSALAAALGTWSRWQPDRGFFWIGGTRLETAELRRPGPDPYVPLRQALRRLGLSYSASRLYGTERILVTTQPLPQAAPRPPETKPGEGIARERPGDPPPEVNPDDIVTVLAPNVIEAIDDPQWVPADKATLSDDTPVVGVIVNGQHRAYSINLLNPHEIVNDELGGRKIAVTW